MAPRGVGVLQLCPCPAPQPRASGFRHPPPPRRAGELGLTSGNARRLGVIPILDAGYQLAAALQRVPADQGWLAAAALRCTEASGESGQTVSTQSTQVPGEGGSGDAMWATATFFWLHHVGSQFPNQGPA